ncbi:MAG TPA: GIY-YIG nuclease family protein [Patescibacteria group bacterium]|nr:GIY-YIG nuclease family protein [Patescibacteria group bacterium]
MLIIHGGCSPARIATQSVAGGSTVAMFYTYVLFSEKDRKFYIGWTDDLKARVESHNKGRVGATRYRIPLRLIYYEACLGKEDAIKREKALKTGFGRAYLERRLKIY